MFRYDLRYCMGNLRRSTYILNRGVYNPHRGWWSGVGSRGVRDGVDFQCGGEGPSDVGHGLIVSSYSGPVEWG